ncbi:MAG TPA: MFS transporter [Syntrophorhabdaceae bacterium]|nr:MFS transporter [Syntrophorhabdaceae bacterium]
MLAAVSIGNLTVSIDNSILAPCLPYLVRIFHTDTNVISWVNIAYLIVSQSFMLTLAKLGDEKGRKLVYLSGMATYTCGLVMCSLAQGVGQLVLARAIQGIGAATTISLSMAIAVAVFPLEERGKTLGILAGINSLGLVAGPVMGGFILDLLGWRAVFFARIPIALTSLFMAWLIIREQKNEDDHAAFDVKGSTALFVFLSGLLLLLSFGARGGFGKLQSAILATLTVLSFILLFRYELQAKSPIINLALFKRLDFAGAATSAFVYSLSSCVAVFVIPFYLIEALGHSGSVVGVYMGLMAAPVVLTSPLSGRLSDRVQPRFVATLGVLINCVALYLLSRLDVNSSLVGVACGALLVGFGLGFFVPPINNIIMQSVPREMLGTASALATTMRQIGISAGMAITGAIYNSQKENYIGLFRGSDTEMLARKAAAAAFHHTLIIGLIIGLLGLGICLSVRSKQD